MTDDVERWIEDPIFVVGCNRSGTTLLFRTLAKHQRLWTSYQESEDLFRDVFPADDAKGDLVEDVPDTAVAEEIARRLYARSHNKEFFNRWPVVRWLPDKLFQRPLRRFYRRPPVRYLDKTPSNCFRIRALGEAFPNARFVFLVRRGEAVVSSLMEGWKYWEEGDYGGENWHYLRPPGWRSRLGDPLVEVCLFQWRTTNLSAREQLAEIPSDRYRIVTYGAMVSDPVDTFRSLTDFLGLSWTPHFESAVLANQDRYYLQGGSPPKVGKWKRLHGEEIRSVRHEIESVNEHVIS